MGKVREPIKKTSIAKKNKIIKKGFELMCEKGYHNVTCVDIAKYCEVSTGIIYQYFADKRDIYVEGVKEYAQRIMFPLLDTLDNKKLDNDGISKLINDMVDILIHTHKTNKKAHEEILAMCHLDEEVNKIFTEREFKMSEKLVSILEYNGFHIESINEKIHIVFGMIDNYCHEVVCHKHEKFDYDIMKKEILNAIELLIGIK